VLIEPGSVRTGIWEQVDRSAEEHADSRYAGAYRRSAAATRLSQPLMADPASVARVIARALESRSPRARYLVGPDAQALALVERLAPTALKDRVSRLLLGL
jgi:NAD(P)-dependent dehydrogenase (short-subunit alcohol dehydrogenase family)